MEQLIIPNVDRHLAHPILDFLQEQGVHPREELVRAKVELLGDTHMLDYTNGLRSDLGIAHDTRSTDAVMRERDTLRGNADRVMAVISDPNVAASLGQDKDRNLATLRDKYKLSVDEINHLYKYGQFAYSCGDYAAAADYLQSFRILSTDPALTMSAFWGKLAANILEEDASPDTALAELLLLRDEIEAHKHSNPPSRQLQLRAAWLHYSLFVYSRLPNGMLLLVDAWSEAFLEVAPSDKDKRRTHYLDAIQSAAPHLLRYLVAALIISHQGPLKLPASLSTQQQSGRSRSLAPKIAHILKITELEQYQYSDPITEFLRLLLGSVDFEGATTSLRTSEALLASDYFLHHHKTAFIDKARHAISEVYCRIHHVIDISDLSHRLGLSPAEGERWIVDLVRDARLDAKIDLASNTVHMNKPTISIHQNISDRAKQLMDRAQAILPIENETRKSNNQKSGLPKTPRSAVPVEA